MYICKECQKECPTYEFLRKHCGRTHKIHSSQVWIEYMNAGMHPVCQCGCGEVVRWRAGLFHAYINGHNARGDTNPMFGKHHTEDAKSNISSKRKEKFAKREYRVWQQEDTEETKERQARINASITKEANPERAKKISAALIGKKHSPEHNKNSRLAIKKAWEDPALRERQRRNRTEYMQSSQFSKPSKLEIRFANILDHLKLTYTRQFSVGGFVFDFCMPNVNILIEVDGDFYHTNPTKWPIGAQYPIQEHNQKNDANKTQAAKDHGYQLLRFWESDINDHPDEVIRTLLNTIADNK